MKIQTLPRLACPVPGCGAGLEVGGFFDPGWSDSAGTELNEGILVCEACDSEYPVLLGVAILVADLHGYLWALWNEIDLAGRQTPNRGISHKMRSYLGVASAYSGQAEPAAPPEGGLDWTTSPYLRTHFDSATLTDDLPGGWLADAVSSALSEPRDPYSFLIGTLKERLGGIRREGLAVEVGTGAGRSAADLAADFEYSIGIDWSFPAVLSARRFHLGEPSRLDHYSMETEKGEYRRRPLESPPLLQNLDFVVADGLALPFASGAAAGAAALNVLCAVPQPRALLDELVRITAVGGLLLICTPYWSDPQPPGPFGRSPQALSGPDDLRAALAGNFTIVAEDRMVPWLLRLAKRRFNLHLCDCLVAVKDWS
jgi:SAM-dependent methyltransferase